MKKITLSIIIILLAGSIWFFYPKEITSCGVGSNGSATELIDLCGETCRCYGIIKVKPGAPPDLECIGINFGSGCR